MDIHILPRSDGDVVAREVIDGADEGVFYRNRCREIWYRHARSADLFVNPDDARFRQSVDAWRSYRAEVRDAPTEEIALRVVHRLRTSLVQCSSQLERADSFWSVLVEQAEDGLL